MWQQCGKLHLLDLLDLLHSIREKKAVWEVYVSTRGFLTAVSFLDPLGSKAQNRRTAVRSLRGNGHDSGGTLRGIGSTSHKVSRTIENPLAQCTIIRVIHFENRSQR